MMAIEQIIRKLEQFLWHLNLEQRLLVLKEVDSYLHECASTNSKQFKLRYKEITRKPELFLNYFLDRHGFERLKIPFFRRVFKATFTLFLALFFSLVLLGFIFFKSMSPLIEINEKSGQVEFFGGKISITQSGYQDHFNVFMKTGEIHESIEKIVIRGNEGSLVLSFSESSKIQYNCYSIDPLKGKNLFDVKNNELFMSFEEGRCELTVPNKTELDLDLNQGHVVLNEPSAPFVLKLRRGNLNWNGEKKKFSLNAKISKGPVIGDISVFQQDSSGIPAEITISQGQLILN